MSGVFAFGKVSAVVGYPYTSKTPMALDIAIDIASGEGNALKRLRVLYIATEGARNARRKAARIAKAKGTSLAELEAWLTITAAPSGFLNAESCALLIDNLRADGYGAVFLDTYGSALDGSIDRNSNAFSDCLKQLGDASDAYALLVVVLLHCRKDKMRGGKPPTLQDIDGHNSVAGAIQGAIALSRPADEDKALIEVTCLRAADDEFPSYCIRWTDLGTKLEDKGLSAEPADHPGEGTGKDRGGASEAEVEARTVQALLELLEGGGSTTLRHFVDRVSTAMGRPKKEALLWKLHDEGLIVISSKTANGAQVITRAARSPRSAEAAAKRGR